MKSEGLAILAIFGGLALVVASRRRAAPVPAEPYVGTRGWAWPRPDVFGFETESTFAEALRHLGYTLPPAPVMALHPEMRKVVATWQDDSNHVHVYAGTGRARLQVDGLLHASDVHALAQDLDIAAHSDLPWPLLVDEARSFVVIGGPKGES